MDKIEKPNFMALLGARIVGEIKTSVINATDKLLHALGGTNGDASVVNTAGSSNGAAIRSPGANTGLQSGKATARVSGGGGKGVAKTPRRWKWTYS